MKTRAAILTDAHRPWQIVELELDEPRPGEVLVRMMVSGLCHSDEHLRDGTLPPRFPMVGGHEGVGVVEAVGPGVDRLSVGDHVVGSFIPSCGTCRYCSTGRQNLCDLGAMLLDGCLPDGTYRFHLGATDVGAMCMLGTFSQWAVLSQYSCVKIPSHISFEVAALVGCGVPTGWGAAVYRGEVRPGDTVVVYGIGGIGINAVQGARHAGARHVIAVDPVMEKRAIALKLGATHEAGTAAEAGELVTALTWGTGADVSIVTVGVVEPIVSEAAFSVLGKGGTMVVVGLAAVDAATLQLPSFFLVNYERQVRGSLFGSANPRHDIPRLLALYEDGTIHLDELISHRYRLDEINDGYDDMLGGKNIRGVIVHEH